MSPARLVPGAVTAGELSPASDTLTDGRSATTYTVDASGPFEIRLVSDDFDPSLSLTSPSGTTFENDDYRGSQRESLVRPSPQADEGGRWVVVAAAFERGQGGRYEILYRPLSPHEAAQAQAEDAEVARADSLSALGLGLQEEGQYTEAESAMREALAIIEAVLGPDHPYVPTKLVDLGGLQWEQGDYAAARLTFERTLAIDEAALGPDHPAVAEDLNNLALVMQFQGDYAAARPLFERSLALSEAAHGPDDLDVATVLNNLAALLSDGGEYAAARPLYERALRIYTSVLGADHPNVGTASNNLAGLLRLQGDYAAALPLFERALAIYEDALGPQHPAVAAALSNMALVLKEQGDYAAARSAIERAIAIQEEALGPDHPRVATALNNLALILRGQGDYAAARPLYERALTIREQALGASHPDVAQSLYNLAGLFYAQGDRVAARPLVERALVVYEGALGADHPDLVAVLNNLVRLHLDADDRPTARQLLGRSVQISDRHVKRLLPLLAPAEQQAFVSQDLSRITGLLFSMAPEDPAFRELYPIVAGWKGLLTHGLRYQQAVASLASDPLHAREVDHLRELRADLARWYSRAGRMPLAVWQVRNDSLTSAKEALERELARALPEEVLPDLLDQMESGGISAVLPEQAAFVDLYRYAHRLTSDSAEARYAAVISTFGSEPTYVDLGRADVLDAYGSTWLDAVLGGEVAELEQEALVRAVWEPVAVAFPSGMSKVWIAPDGELVRLPWSVLVSAHSSTAALTVAEVGSARDLAVLLTAPTTERGDSPSILLVGGVDFGSDPGGGDLYSPLLGTEREVTGLARIAGGEGFAPLVLTGDEATSDAVSAALPRAEYAHLATHGFFYGESRAVYAARGGAGGSEGGGTPLATRSPLVESGLALAGANVDPAGQLTAEQLVGLDLSGTRLVVLSACETGRGTEVTGQGVLGLRSAFAAAGARSVLMSLWEVPDASTAVLMEAFYRGLWERGLRPATALRRAQEAVRSDPRYVAPVHWAAWTLAGDP